MTQRPTAQALSLDETFDRVFSRPLGRAIARVAARTPLTANHVSGIALLFGAVSGAFVALPWPYPSFGALGLVAYMVLDCADGELARIKGGGGWRGRMIDGYADLVTAFAVHLGMVLAIIRDGVHFLGVYELPAWGVFVIGTLAGASMSWNSGVVDGLKQALKGDSVDRKRAEITCDARGPFDWFLWYSFRFYVARIDRVDRGLPSDYGLFRRAQWVGPTHHHFGMAVTALAVGFFPQAYYAFFLFCAIPANLYLLAILWMARRGGQSPATA